ncbi:MAG: aminoglycoside phosphotransferase family protein [Alphaproteobacteria bacterium]
MSETGFDRAAALADVAAARAGLRAWAGRIDVEACLRPIPQGLLNATFAVGDPPRCALQLVHPQFGAAENARLAAMAPVLAEAGVAIPALVETDEGARGVAHASGAAWRLTTWLAGEGFERVPSPAHAASAAALLARFHDVLAGADFAAWPASAFHDTDGRMQALSDAVPDDTDGEARRLGEAILARWEAFRVTAEVAPTAARPGHGDPKISNFLFRGADCVGLLDLDTAARFPLEDDLGDAMRSWCNPAGEDDPDGPFDEAVFAAAVAGYLGRARTITSEERGRIVFGTVRIALELASRFCLDAIRQDYFGWNPAVAPTRRAHNLIRARGQLALADQLIGRRAALEQIVAAS